MRLIVDGNYLRVADASPVEAQWLRDFLSWEGRTGSTETVLRTGEDEQLYTYRHLLPLIREQALGLVDLEVQGVSVTDPEVWEGVIDANCLAGVTLYAHQTTAIKKALRGREGILSLATAAGKTKILLGLIRHRNPRQCFILAPTMYLAEMICADALEAGFSESEVGVLHGSRKELRTVTVAVVDSLLSSVRKNDKFGQALRSCDLLLADEGHHLQSESWREVWWASASDHKIAVTATPFNNIDGNPMACKADAMTLATAGPILYHVSNEYLISKGIVAQTYCVYLPTKGRKLAYKVSPTLLHTREIVNNLDRNEKIVGACLDARSFGFEVLILVSRVDHARKLMEMLRGERVICKFQGSSSLQFDRGWEIREESVTLTGPGSWVDRFEDGEWDIIIASQVLDEGVDIPDIGFTILAGGNKSVRQNIQRRGRGSRRKKTGLNWAFMVDFMDKAHIWHWQHSRKRRALFEASGTIVMEDTRRFWRLVKQCADSKK